MVEKRQVDTEIRNQIDERKSGTRFCNSKRTSNAVTENHRRNVEDTSPNGLNKLNSLSITDPGVLIHNSSNGPGVDQENRCPVSVSQTQFSPQMSRNIIFNLETVQHCLLKFWLPFKHISVLEAPSLNAFNEKQTKNRQSRGGLYGSK